MLKQAAASVLCLCAWMAGAMAQSTAVVPPSVESTAGLSGNSIPLGNFASGTYQVLYTADQLAAIPAGSVITGLQLRMWNGATTNFPVASTNITRYEVRLAASLKTPETMDTSFAANMVNPVLVRSGALVLPPNAYTSGASGMDPEAWGSPIAFATGYRYAGGALVIEFRSQNAGSDFAHYAEIVSVAGKIANVRSSDANGTVAGTSDATGVVVRLTFTPPPVDLAEGVTKVIVEEEKAATPGQINLSTLMNTSGRTNVSVMGAEQFDTIGSNSQIVGVSTRIAAAQAAWPPAVRNFAQYNIQLSRSQNGPGLLSTTVASNVGADAVNVRSGSLSVAANSFGAQDGQSTAPFDFGISFRNVYNYRGGPLLMVVDHSGNASGDSPFLDAIATNEPSYNTRVQSLSAFTAGSATTTSAASFTIARFDVNAGTSSPLSKAALPPDGGSLAWVAVMQTVISASELKNIPVGSVIDSLWLRQAAGAGVGPSTNVSSLDFEVYLSTAARRPESMSTTFAINEGSDRVLVHDGPWSVPAGVLPAAATGNFGKIVQFRKGFVYKGGDLCVTTRHTGLSDPLGVPEAVMNTLTTNRSIYSFDAGSATGLFYSSDFTGTSMKLGYIPSVMAPNNLATAEGVDGLSVFSSNYTVQTIIPASQLRSVDVGSAITGMSLRLSSSGGGSTYPTTGTTLPRYDVTISSTNVSPLAMSTSYANNALPGGVLVRSGSMFVPQDAFPASGSASVPSENAWYVPFTRAYVYQGGNLCVTIRSEGSLPGASFVDVDGSAASARGGTMYTTSDSNSLVATGSLGGLGLRLAFTARAFCPWDLNNDGVVDDADFSLFAVSYNTLECNDPSMAFGCPSDFNYDRIVDDADFSLFIVMYNEFLCPE